MSLTPSQSVKTRHMRVKRDNDIWTIGGMTWDEVVESGYKKVLADPDLNDIEIWEIENSSGGWFHPVHIHLVDFQILSRNGKAPFPYERGPKDVVYVGEGETVRLLMKFGPHRGRYMIHCHNLPHEDHDMMAQFSVGYDTNDPDPNDPIEAVKPHPIGPVTPVEPGRTEPTETAPVTRAGGATGRRCHDHHCQAPAEQGHRLRRNVPVHRHCDRRQRGALRRHAGQCRYPPRRHNDQLLGSLVLDNQARAFAAGHCGAGDSSRGGTATANVAQTEGSQLVEPVERGSPTGSDQRDGPSRRPDVPSRFRSPPPATLPHFRAPRRRSLTFRRSHGDALSLPAG